jgi:hypothetical protein
MLRQLHIGVVFQAQTAGHNVDRDLTVMRRRIGKYARLNPWCENERFIQNRLSDSLRSFQVEDECAVRPDFVGEAAAQTVTHARTPSISCRFHCKNCADARRPYGERVSPTSVTEFGLRATASWRRHDSGRAIVGPALRRRHEIARHARSPAKTEDAGAEPFTMEPDKFDIYVKSEIAKSITLVKALGGAPK